MTSDPANFEPIPPVSNLPVWKESQPGLVGQVADFVFGFCLGLGVTYLVAGAVQFGGGGC